MSEWPQKTLGDLITLQRGIDLPEAERGAGAVPIMGSFGITGRHNKAACKGPGVTVGRSGASAGTICYIEEDFWPLNTCLYVRDFKGNDRRFVYYFLKTFDLARLNSGSAQPSLNRNFVHPVPAAFPEPPEQIAIASILGALDDKIELNRQMNETLEAMARAVFKDWFVDFGPTRAKMEGSTPYLTPEIWSLFPDRLDDEGKPEGWDNKYLGDFTELQNGYAFKSSDWQKSGVPVVKIGSVKPSVVDLTQVSFVSEILAQERSAFRLNVGDVLVGLTGYVGETGRVPPTDNRPLLNQRVGRFSTSGRFSPFVYSCVRSPEFKVFAEGKGHGSAQANVSTKDLLSYPVINSCEKVRAAYDKIMGPFYDEILSNLGEISTLAATRNLLLPKLMSGEIRVQDAEKVLEAVA